MLLLVELMFPKEIQVAISLMFAFTVDILEGVDVELFSFYL